MSPDTLEAAAIEALADVSNNISSQDHYKQATRCSPAGLKADPPPPPLPAASGLQRSASPSASHWLLRVWTL